MEGQAKSREIPKKGFFRMLRPLWHRCKGNQLLEAPLFPNLGKDSIAKASLNAGNSLLAEAKKRHGAIALEVRAGPPPYESLAPRLESLKAEIACADEAYKKALNLSEPNSGEYAEAAGGRLECLGLYRKCSALSFGCLCIEGHALVLRRDSALYRGLSGKAQKSAVEIIRLIGNGSTIGEILTNFTPAAGFTMEARGIASSLFAIANGTPELEPCIRRIMKEYCELVAAQKAN